MRSLGVVVVHPSIQSLLQLRDRGVLLVMLGKELRTDGFVPPLHLAGGGRRPGCGQQMPDPVLGANPVEQHLGRAARRPESPGEDFPIVSEDLLRNPVSAQRRQQRLTHRSGGGPPHQLGRNCEPRAVVDPRHRLQLSPIGQVEPADHIDLPQLHRPGSLPAPIIRPAPAPRPRHYHGGTRATLSTPDETSPRVESPLRPMCGRFGSSRKRTNRSWCSACAGAATSSPTQSCDCCPRVR
jgi:hypothetical protein